LNLHAGALSAPFVGRLGASAWCLLCDHALVPTTLGHEPS